MQRHLTCVAFLILAAVTEAAALTAAEPRERTGAARPAATATATTAAPTGAPAAAAPGAETAVPPAAGDSLTSPLNLVAPPYSYNADGRRDPFTNLIAPTTTETTKAAPRPTGSGLGAIRVEDLSVRGVMQSHERLVAMIQGPDNRTYLIHQGDKLADGAVKSITPQGLVLVQDVSDPRAKEKTREVRKLLRAPEDEKE